MALVEAVRGESRDAVEEVLGGFVGDSLGDGAFDELLPLLRHLDPVFLAHRGAQDVGLGKLEAGQHPGRLHDLLLVGEDAVRAFENRLEPLVRILDALAPVLPSHIGRDVLHRPGAEQGDRDDDVLESRRPHVHDHPAHARAFQLEHAMGVPVGDQPVRLRVVVRDLLDVDDRTGPLLDEAQTSGDDVEVLQAQEVDLQEADVADRLHVVLRDHRLASRAVLQRRVVHQRLGCDHHTRRVGADVA